MGNDADDELSRHACDDDSHPLTHGARGAAEMPLFVGVSSVTGMPFHGSGRLLVPRCLSRGVFRARRMVSSITAAARLRLLALAPTHALVRTRKVGHLLFLRPVVVSFAAIFLLILSQLDAPRGILNAAESSESVTDRFHPALFEPMPPGNVHTRDKPLGSFELAIFLQVSASSLPLLPRLLDRLYHVENIYLIHFDSDISRVEGLRTLQDANISDTDKQPANIHILPQETINYRGVSMTLNTVNAMSAALELSVYWRYFINLSGADYPLVTASQLRSLLAHEGVSREFFSFNPDKVAQAMLQKRMQTFAIDAALGFNKEKVPVQPSDDINPLLDMLHWRPAYAEAWMIVSRAFCRYATASPFARRILITFAYSMSSPEHYFATLVRNAAPFNNTVVSHSMRLVKWTYLNYSAGQHPYYLDDLYDRTKESRRDLVESPLLFARKFRRTYSPLMDDVDAATALPEHSRKVTTHFYAYLGLRVPESR